jgi:hypothetical protein
MLEWYVFLFAPYLQLVYVGHVPLSGAARNANSRDLDLRSGRAAG